MPDTIDANEYLLQQTGQTRQPGESKPGTGPLDRLSYLGNRIARGFASEMQPEAQTDPTTGQKFYIDPISKERTSYPPMYVPPITPAPDRATEVLGSGIENMIHHPLLSWWMPGITAGTGMSNELLRNQSPEVREAAGAALGLLGLRGLARMPMEAANILGGHHGGILTMLSSLLHAPASTAPPRSLAWLLGRGARVGVGAAEGSETPASRNALSGTQASPP